MTNHLSTELLASALAEQINANKIGPSGSGVRLTVLDVLFDQIHVVLTWTGPLGEDFSEHRLLTVSVPQPDAAAAEYAGTWGTPTTTYQRPEGTQVGVPMTVGREIPDPTLVDPTLHQKYVQYLDGKPTQVQPAGRAGRGVRPETVTVQSIDAAQPEPVPFTDEGGREWGEPPRVIGDVPPAVRFTPRDQVDAFGGDPTDVSLVYTEPTATGPARGNLIGAFYPAPLGSPSRFIGEFRPYSTEVSAVMAAISGGRVHVQLAEPDTRVIPVGHIEYTRDEQGVRMWLYGEPVPAPLSAGAEPTNEGDAT